jgi:hypothetical protein
MNSKIKIALAAAMLAGTSAALAQAQSPVVHAARGQGAQQQARDESACQTQARKRTGYDPISIAANSQPFQPGKDMTAVPIEAPTTAMGASSAGATSAGAGETGMEQGGVAGATGATGGSQAGATGMPETGTMPPAATTGGAMARPGAPAGTTAQAGTSGATGTEQAGGMEHAKKHHKMKKHHEGAAGGSAAGATGAGGGQEFAMQNSLDVYNKAYASCLKGRGYVVETTSQ